MKTAELCWTVQLLEREQVRLAHLDIFLFDLFITWQLETGVDNFMRDIILY